MRNGTSWAWTTWKAARRFGLAPALALGALGVALSGSPARAQNSSANIFYIPDPSLGMNAAAVTMPPKWHGQGTLFNGGDCNNSPYIVFRATSPDGLSYFERLPALAWTWGTGPVAEKDTRDCFPVTGEMSAKDFLKYLARTMNVEYVSDAPVADDRRAAVKKLQDDANARTAVGRINSVKSMDIAAAYIRSKNGTFAMKGWFEAIVDCNFHTIQGIRGNGSTLPNQPDSYVHVCTAGVRYMVAPEAQFSAVQSLWAADGMGGKVNQAWAQAFYERRNDQQLRENANNIQAQKNHMAAQQQQFNHDQAVRQQMHEQFLASMQRSTDASMARTQQAMNARGTAASDWVDYSLDQKTVADPNTGQISKVSNSYTHTWVDSTGKMSYQTNYSGANPNGVLPGNWTEQQTVHGDGTPQ